MAIKQSFKRSLLIVTPLVAIGGGLALGGGVSAGSAAFGVDYYISAPLVQGSYVSGILETFNGATGTCPSSLTGGITWTGAVSNSCLISSVQSYGGATSTASTPAVGGVGSNFATTNGSNNDERIITFTMPEPQKYLGFWWSAGSNGNTVTFYSGEDEVLQLTTDAIFALLGTAPATEGDWESSGTIEANSGTDYPKHHYFANPRGYTSTTLDWSQYSSNSLSNTEPFVYLHVFSQGGMTFDRVVFAGPGFEFDNFVVSPLAQPVDPSLAYVSSVEGTPPVFGGAPDIDLDHYRRQAELAEGDLPDTGSNSSQLEWFAGALLAVGVAVSLASRRPKRV